MTIRMESAVIGAVVLVKHMLPYLSDALLLDNLKVTVLHLCFACLDDRKLYLNIFFNFNKCS